MRYREVYPGLDVVYYGKGADLEYDFVLKPGADPAIIALQFDGVDNLEIDAGGGLVPKTILGEIRQPAPVIYQETARGLSRAGTSAPVRPR